MQQVTLGQIVAPHGVRGDLRILPLTDNVGLFQEMEYLLLPDGRRLTIVRARPHRNLILVTTEEIHTVEAAEALRGLRVSVRREDLPALPEGRYYVGDLLGMDVVDEAGQSVGIFKDVLKTGSADVYVIASPQGQDILVANVPDNIRDIDVAARRMVVRLPEWDGEDIR